MSRRAWLWSWACVALVACAPENIIVAYGPDAMIESDAGEAGPEDATTLEDAAAHEDARGPRDASSSDAMTLPADACFNDEGCAPGEFCSHSRCNEPRGTCVRPSQCNAAQDPVCGCDGVTYFNDCLRIQYGQNRMYSGECKPEHASRCFPPQGIECGGDAKCATLFYSNSCEFPTYGKCWILPDCSFLSGGPRFQSCLPGPTGERTCVNVCKAIESEVPHASGCSGGRPPGP